MKKATLYLILFVIFEAIFPMENFALKNPLYNLNVYKPNLIKAEEYIEISRFTAKFLFKTNLGARVEFYIGENKDALSLVKMIENYDFRNGLKIDNLVPGKTYFYQVSSWINGKRLDSPILSFVKQNKENVNIVPEWAKTAVFYEVFIRSFADGNNDGVGDLKGLTEKMDYFKKLGITALWLMPHFESNTYHGYDVVDFYKVNPDYGSLKDFEVFLKKAHQNNIKVIIDLVINHSSNKNEWFTQAAGDLNNKYRNYYIWSDEFDDIRREPWYKINNSYYLAIFESRMPDLNYRRLEVRNEMKKVAKFWLDLNGDGNLDDGVDGFRLDATLHIDTDQEVTHGFLQEFNTYVKSVNPNAFIVGEEWERPMVVAPYFKDVESSFNFEINKYIFQMAKGQDTDILNIIKSIYQEYSKYSTDFVDSTLLSNHDQKRIASIFNGNIHQQKLAAAIFLTLPGTPFIYYGDELGQKGWQSHPNVREAFDWYTSASGPKMTNSELFLENNVANTVPQDGISVEEELDVSDSLLNYYIKLIKIRKENLILFTGNYTRINTPKNTYGYKIEGMGNYNLTVVHNIGKEITTMDIGDQGYELISDKFLYNKKINIGPCETVVMRFRK